eukprot:g63284.t1
MHVLNPPVLCVLPDMNGTARRGGGCAKPDGLCQGAVLSSPGGGKKPEPRAPKRRKMDLDREAPLAAPHSCLLQPFCPHTHNPEAAPLCFEQLPDALLTFIFSLLEIKEHFTLLPLLPRSCRRLLKRRSAWPRELIVKEDTQGGIKLGKCANHESGEFNFVATSRGNIPDTALAFLRRVGFTKLRGCGPRSLHMLSNPYTRLLQGENLDLSTTVLEPLSRMHGMFALALHRCAGTTDAGLIHLRGLPLNFLSIDGLLDEKSEIAITGATLEGLKNMPLRTLSLLLPYGRTDGKGLASYLPRELPLETLLIGFTQLTDRCFQLIGQYKHLRTFTSCKPSTMTTGEGLSALAACRELEEVAMTGLLGQFQDANLARLRGLPLKKLCLSHSNISGAGLEALADAELPLELLELDTVDVSDADLLTLKRLPLTSLRLRECDNITQIGVDALKAAMRIDVCFF